MISGVANSVSSFIDCKQSFLVLTRIFTPQTLYAVTAIPVNSHSLGVSLTLFEIQYDLTPDFTKQTKSHSFSTVSFLNCVLGI